MGCPLRFVKGSVVIVVGFERREIAGVRSAGDLIELIDEKLREMEPKKPGVLKIPEMTGCAEAFVVGWC